MSGPDQLFEQVLDQLLRLVLVHAQLVEDDHTLLLDVCGVQPGVGHNVEEDVHAKARVLRRDAHPVGGQLLVRGRVDEAADSLDGVGDLFRGRPAARAFEVEVLDEVGHAAKPVVLQSRAPGEHQDDARGMALGHRFEDEASAAAQLVDVVRRRHGNGKYRSG